LKGANRTGRPFLGDYAGELLYRTLLKVGLARGVHDLATPEALTLVDCMITNAVRCVPPENKPTPEEAKTCRIFLKATLEGMPKLKAIVALGRVAHEATLRAFEQKPSQFTFAHGAKHALPRAPLFDSFHCSRYNTNTGKLTTEMFEAVFAQVRAALS